MFKKTIFLFTLLLAACLGGIYMSMIHLSVDEEQAYVHLMQEDLAACSKQTRQGKSPPWIANHIRLSVDDTFFLEADNGKLTDLYQPIELQGNIRLIAPSWQEKKLYALADTAHYYPDKRVCFLHGSLERNVLCWQDGALFSAPELHIHENLKTIEVLGDARFSFNIEEQQLFERIFSRYL